MSNILEATFAILIFPGGAFALALGLFLKGMDRKVLARLQRRVGPPIIQPLLDLFKLSIKETLIPNTANEVAFRLAPVLGLTGVLVTAAVMPVGGVWSGVTGLGDILVLLYLLPIPAMALMLAGCASSSPYGALGFVPGDDPHVRLRDAAHRAPSWPWPCGSAEWAVRSSPWDAIMALASSCTAPCSWTR